MKSPDPAPVIKKPHLCDVIGSKRYPGITCLPNIELPPEICQAKRSYTMGATDKSTIPGKGGEKVVGW